MAPEPGPAAPRCAGPIGLEPRRNGRVVSTGLGPRWVLQSKGGRGLLCVLLLQGPGQPSYEQRAKLRVGHVCPLVATKPSCLLPSMCFRPLNPTSPLCPEVFSEDPLDVLFGSRSHFLGGAVSVVARINCVFHSMCDVF